MGRSVHTGRAMEPTADPNDGSDDRFRDDVEAATARPAAPPGTSPTTHTGGLRKAATVLAWCALPLLLSSALLFTIPVQNPGVQHCGSPAVFLLKATSDRPLIDDDGKPVNGWDRAQLRAADAQRCSKVVARRAVPAGGLLIAFWVVAFWSVLLGWAAGRTRRIEARQARRNQAYEPPTPIDV